MLELVPNNTKRVEFTVFTPNAAGTNTPAAGLTVTVRVALAATSTSHVGSMSYTATEYTLQGSSSTGPTWRPSCPERWPTISRS
jgi:hypothetical protein